MEKNYSPDSDVIRPSNEAVKAIDYVNKERSQEHKNYFIQLDRDRKTHFELLQKNSHKTR